MTDTTINKVQYQKSIIFLWVLFSFLLISLLKVFAINGISMYNARKKVIMRMLLLVKYIIQQNFKFVETSIIIKEIWKYAFIFDCLFKQISLTIPWNLSVILRNYF